MCINEQTRALQQPLIGRQSLSLLDELRHGQTELSLSHRQWKGWDRNPHHMLVYPTCVLLTASVNSPIYHTFNFPFSDP